MRILGSVVCRNEADRYLESVLSWYKPMLDDIFFYDDRSTDDSADIAKDAGCVVRVRPKEVPAFIEHEGEFRGNAWKGLETTLKPEPRDWILSFDCDEFLVDMDGRHGEGPGATLGTLRAACASSPAAVAVILPIAEVFAELAIGRLLIRKDGYWGGIRAPRLFRYQSGGLFSNKTLGSGSEPTYVAKGKKSDNNWGLTLVHLGYLTPEDQKTKYERYSTHENSGHNSAHIRSILNSPHLEHFDGPTPLFWRGHRG